MKRDLNNRDPSLLVSPGTAVKDQGDAGSDVTRRSHRRNSGGWRCHRCHGENDNEEGKVGSAGGPGALMNASSSRGARALHGNDGPEAARGESVVGSDNCGGGENMDRENAPGLHGGVSSLYGKWPEVGWQGSVEVQVICQGSVLAVWLSAFGEVFPWEEGDTKPHDFPWWLQVLSAHTFSSHSIESHDGLGGKGP